MKLLAVIAVLLLAAPANAQTPDDDEPAPPANPADPAATPAGPAAPTTQPSSVPEVSAPSALLLSYTIDGVLLEKERLVRGFLDGVMPINQPWTDQQQVDITEFCKELGYFVGIRNERVPEGVIAHLSLQPVTLVRHIDVQIAGPGVVAGLLTFDWARSVVDDRIFKEDVRRRMRLQIGRPVPIDEATRTKRLAEERDRILDYLADEGFFEATAKLRAVPDGPNAVKLMVRVDPGPEYFVGKVNVVGNKEVAEKEIVALFHHKRLVVPTTKFGLLTQRFSRSKLKTDIDAVTELYKKRGFPGVRVRTNFDRATSFKRNRKRVDFTVIIRERRRLEIYFEGIEGVDERDVREALTFDEEGSYDDFEIERSAAAIRRVYQQKGFFEVNILWERVSFRMPEQLFDRVVFTIDEGPKLKVRSIQFDGNRGITDAKLRAMVKTREYPRFFLSSGGYASSLQLEQDTQRITAAYRRLGYADVVVEYEATRDQRLIGNAPALGAAIVSGLPADGLYVRFRIQEGKRQTVSEVVYEFVDAHDKSAADLRKVADLAPGSAYTKARAEADGERITRYYFKQGYPRAEVKTRERRSASGRITVVHEVREGLAVRFGKVAIRGNFKTQDWVIREELRLREGAPFTLGRAEAAQRNLRTSGLFSTVRFKYVGLDDKNKKTINVVLHVQERYDHRLEWSGGAGYSTDERLFGEARATLPSIWGTGARFSATTIVGEQQQDLRGTLLLPRWMASRFLGLRFRTEASAFYNLENTERFGDLESFGTSTGVALEGQPGGDWDGWFLGLRYNFRQRNRDEELVRSSGASDDIQNAKVRTRTGAIGPQLVLDKRTDEQGRRNPLSPEAGWRIELSALFADDALGGDDRFVKLGGKGLHYKKLGSRFLITNGLRYDHGIPLGGAVVLPEVERFFAGGDTTVRGFEEDRLLTEVVEEDLPPLGGIRQFRVLPAGGNIRVLHNFELQMQVWDQSFVANLPWASAIFLDTGLITNSFDGVKLRDLRHSLGIAFWRLVTPVGSLSIEWAVPLDPNPGDNPRGRLHLNLGFVFK